MITAALLALSALSATAEAGPHSHRPATRHARPATRVSSRLAVRVGPWSVRYRPAPRLGYVWIAGAIVRGVYLAGYWRPSTPPPTEQHTWVDGYWEGEVWVDGYWHIGEIDGMIWIDGEYDDSGEVNEGYWEEPAPDTRLAIPMNEAEVYPEEEEESDIHHAPPDRW